jgi:hypothetical protein
MDCETFEAATMDELYGELDELTSAAVKRHASGCSRCAALLDGLRATRRVATLPELDVPEGLTDRILAAVDGSTVVPLRRRAARALSVAGTWAMRPQSAMAAVFMVMLGTSLLLLRGRSSRAPAESVVTVTEHGTPAPAVRPPAPQAPTAEPPPLLPSYTAGAFAAAGPPPTAAARAEPKTMPAAAAPAVGANTEPSYDDLRGARAAPKAARDEEAPGLAMGSLSPAYPAPARPAVTESASPASFDAAVRLYESGRFDQALKAFEALATQDVNADLYAARSIREGKGCRQAVARFDRVAQRGTGTAPGWDALLEGAICYRQMGDFPDARVRLTPLLSVDSHRDRARAEMDRLGP